MPWSSKNGNVVAFTRRLKRKSSKLPSRGNQRKAVLVQKQTRDNQFKKSCNWLGVSLKLAWLKTFTGLGLMVLRLLTIPLKLFGFACRIFAVVAVLVAIWAYVSHVKTTPQMWQQGAWFELFTLLGAVSWAWMELVIEAIKGKLLRLQNLQMEHRAA